MLETTSDALTARQPGDWTVQDQIQKAYTPLAEVSRGPLLDLHSRSFLCLAKHSMFS